MRESCLEMALVWHEDMGVWGGMGEGERRRFQAHLKMEGYGDEVPHGEELRASLFFFYLLERNTKALNMFYPKAAKRRAS